MCACVGILVFVCVCATSLFMCFVCLLVDRFVGMLVRARSPVIFLLLSVLFVCSFVYAFVCSFFRSFVCLCVCSLIAIHELKGSSGGQKSGPEVPQGGPHWVFPRIRGAKNERPHRGFESLPSKTHQFLTL